MKLHKKKQAKNKINEKEGYKVDSSMEHACK